MSARTALGAPLALSLAGHAALLAVLAGAGFVAGRPARPDAERVVPVKRAVDLPAPAGRRLRVEVGEPAPGPPPAGSDEAAVALDTADPRYRPYLSGVKQRIWERWGAPGLPEGAAARGALVVEFTLTRSGRLAASGVRETPASRRSTGPRSTPSRAPSRSRRCRFDRRRFDARPRPLRLRLTAARMAIAPQAS